MKRLKFFFSGIVLMFAFSTIGFSQQRAAINKFTAAVSPDEILTAAKEIRSKAGTRGWDFLTKSKVKTAYEKRVLEQYKKGHSIIARVLSRGDKMTTAEAARYDTQMQKVVKTMNAIQASNHGASSGSQGECFGSCDSQYIGWGHGHGWNRFWCKASCFKIEVHVA